MLKKISNISSRNPKVTAVLFFYNDERIYDLIEVAVRQLYQFEKLIVFNDGSTENYDAKIKNICKVNPKISYYSDSINKGIAYAMKSAILNVRDEYFYLMSCGDIYENSLLKDFNNLKWDKIYPGIIASGVLTQVEGSSKKNLYQQFANKNKLYSDQEYAYLSRKHTNLYYGGGCIVNTKLGKDAAKYFGNLEWASDFFMYHYAAFKSGVIFTNSVSMCNLIHLNRYCDNSDSNKNFKIIMEFIRSAKYIDIHFYKYCYNSAILPRYSINILIKLFLSSEFRGYINGYIIYRCLFINIGKKLSILIPVKLKNYLRFYLGL